MSTQELIVWQPCANLIKNTIFLSDMTLNEFGLILTLTDSEGNMVDIVYNKASHIIGDYVWSYRYTNEVPMSGLAPLMEAARKETVIDDSQAPIFYKMKHSEYIKWYDQLGFIPSTEIPHLEHHLIPVADGVYEIISDYEPKIIDRGKMDFDDYLHENLKQTRDALLEEISSLNYEDFNKKPSKNQWSIAQVCYHLYLVEHQTTKAIFWGLRKNLTTNVKRKDILSALDRSKKIEAPKFVEPEQEPFVLQHIQAMLRDSRHGLIRVLQSTDKNLLSKRSMKHPVFGELALDQWVDLVALHEQRHLEQIKEIKARIENK